MAGELDTASTRAYTELRSLILRQKLRPGERTSVAALAERMGIGRTPVKEAVTRLATEGLLEVSDRRGTYVPIISEADIVEMFALRRLLEGYAADLIAKKDGELDLSEPQRALETMAAISRVGIQTIKQRREFIETDVRFHAEIIALAGVSRLNRMYGLLDLHVQIAVYLAAPDREAMRLRQHEHEAIYAALVTRDAARLTTSLDQHARSVEQSVLMSLAE